ncbi:Kap123p [Sugiyamaella lignohabitans]|uniref:Kap123p n=1 Tax=Sugiyamaella lignohabitans TaxID=796027 RepID=A0A161HHC6_9ASCO|nr:Kap123p [Sugiyamaella lignohabitans]ANB11517.1 Kap123p [Sugiyamaella lignohabitans]
MDPQFLASLEETLKHVTAPSTEAIKLASAKLQNDFYTNPKVIPALVHLLQSHPDAQIRQLAGVEARKLVGEFWTPEKLPEQEMTSIKTSILQSTLQEQTPLVRHTSSRVISAIAKIDVDEGKWNELLPFLYQTCKSSSAAEREVAVYILYTLLEADADVLIDGSVELLHLFSHTINDPESLQVRVSTVLGLGKVSENIDTTAVDSKAPQDQNPVELFRALLPSAVEVLNQVISSDDEKSALQVFDVFSGLLVCDYALISKHMKDLVNFMLTNIAGQKQLSDEIRLAALQFLLAAIRFKKNKIQSLKLGPVLTNAALEISAEPFDEEDDETNNEDDEDTPAKRALLMIDALSSSLPPTQVMAPLLAALPHCASSQDIFQRRAGFLALSQAVEGAPDFVANQISAVLPLVVQGLQDANQMVKVSALMALAQLAGELHDVIGEHHEALLPLVFSIMDGASSLKVGKSACLALDAILETLEADIITQKYLPELIPKLLHLLNHTSDLTLKGSIVAAIASAAFAAGKSFEPFFVHTISALEPFIRVSVTSETVSEEELTLCGITLDALSALAGAVGKETFRPYVQPLIEAAYKCLQSTQSRLKECGFIFLGTLARIYETEFAPFLGMVVPAIFASFDQDEFAGMGEEDDEAEDVNIGQDGDEEDLLNKFSVNSALAIEKEIATDTLGEIIVGTKEHFNTYLEQAIEHLKLLTDHFYEGIRKSALIVLWRAYVTFYKQTPVSKQAWVPGFPSSVVLAEPAATLLEVARTTTLNLFSTEDDRSVATIICDHFVEAIRTSGPVVLGSQDDLEKLCSEVILILSKSHHCQVQDEDDIYDGVKPEEEEGDGENAEYDEVLTDSASDVVVQLAAALGPQFLPLFPTFFGLVSKYATSKSSQERASGIGALSEIINGLRSNVTQWTKELMQLLLHALGDADLEVRSNAAYGVGLLILYSDDVETCKSHYTTVLQKLQRLLKKVDKKKRKSFGTEEEDNSARSLANACGCVARMSSKYPELVPLAEVVPVLVSRLPLQDGFEENTPIFEFILKLFEQREPSIVQLRAEIVQIFNEVFQKQAELEKEEDNKNIGPGSIVKPFENDEIRAKVVALLKFLEQEQPGLVSSHPILAPVIA